MTTIRLQIFGRVQGVGFRFFIKTQADSMGVAGWVRNRGDGSVEVVLQGSAKEQLSKLIEIIKKGSQTALVEDILISNEEDSKHVTGFVIRK